MACATPHTWRDIPTTWRPYHEAVMPGTPFMFTESVYFYTLQETLTNFGLNFYKVSRRVGIIQTLALLHYAHIAFKKGF